LTKPAAPILFSVEGLSRPGLAPVELRLAAGSCTVIAGPSGAGKSLFLRALADLDPNEGTVRLDGIERASLPAPEWRRRVTYVPAESGWWAPTVGAHMTDPVAAAKDSVRLGLPDDTMSWPVSRLSTGEKQRLALVRALQNKPKVLLLDEPTAGLDPAAKEKTEAMIKDVCAEGTAVVVVSHEGAQADRLNARRYRMVAGTLSPESRPEGAP
jgi:phosphate-transporting ATPase